MIFVFLFFPNQIKSKAVFLNLFLPRGTLDQLLQYFVAPRDAKIVKNINEVKADGTLGTIAMHPSVSWHLG